MNRVLVLSLFLLPFLATGTSVPVVLPGTNAVDRIAAAEFVKYYGQMTGVWPEVSVQDGAAAEAAAVRGAGAAAVPVVRPPRPHTPVVKIGRSFAKDLTFGTQLDSYRIKSVVEGGVTNLILAGGNDRSTMYAVYDYFERNGCRWFWDGDVVPRAPALPLGGYDVYEVSRFEYRATRYFAHRGLTRFQAEQWGLDDWKKEIDWLLKARLNVFFLRVGMDDLFQKAFPEYCSYPDPSKPLPGQGKGYDNRHLFWSLEYRGKLRHDLQAYAFDRGLIVPEDFGTITHWYTRTPEDFIENAKPDFLKEPHSEYGYSAQKSGCVWDVMQDKWMDAYWKLTETSMREYGRPGYLHTIGFSERTMSTNRAENLAIKQATTKRMFDRALKAQPDAKIFFAGWDFHSTWTPEEIRAYVPTLDPKHVVIWDYEWDAYRPKWKSGQFSVPTEWGLVGGKVPYTFGQFFYYRATFPHTDYDLVAERFAQVKDDPACVGYILWPEASHTDILQLRDFTDNAWRPVDRTTDELVDTFCRDRYGEQAAAFAAIWKDVIPISVKAKGNGRWGATYGTAMIHTFANEPSKNADGVTNRVCWAGRFFPDADFAAAPKVFRRLADLRWEDPMAQRDAIDLARTVGDRLTLDAFAKAMLAYFDWRDGCGTEEAEMPRSAAASAAHPADRLASAAAGAAAVRKDHSAAASAAHPADRLTSAAAEAAAVRKDRSAAASAAHPHQGGTLSSAGAEGSRSTEEIVRTRFATAQSYVRLMARTLALHTDHSLCDSYDRLNAIEPIRYPGFGRTLIDNTMNFYCAAHQAELAEHVYVPMFDSLVAQVEDRLAKGDRKTPLSSKLLRDIEDKVRETPLMDLRLTTPRTPANYRRTMLDWAAAIPVVRRPSAVSLRSAVPRPHTLASAAAEAAAVRSGPAAEAAAVRSGPAAEAAAVRADRSAAASAARPHQGGTLACAAAEGGRSTGD